MITINARKLGVLCGFILLASAPALAGLKLNAEKKGSYIYWLAYKDGLGANRVTQPQRFKGKSTEVDLSMIGAGCKEIKLFVMDKRSGNLAIAEYIPPKDPKAAKPIDLTNDDFCYVRSVRLRAIAEDNRPLESGLMTITDGVGTEMTSIITPADIGTASFENVAAGEINVKVKAEGLTKTIDSDFELPLKRAQPGFARDIRIAGDVSTLQASPKAQAAAARPGASKRSGVTAGFLQFLAGLLLVFIIIAVIAAVLGAKGVTMRRAMENLGVQFPQDKTAEPGTTPPAVDESICQFCGQKKDAAGRCACTVSPGVAPKVSPGAAASSGLRLVGTQGAYAGHIFEIKQGTTTIGREAGNDIALTDDTTTSRRHATIIASGADITIRDEGSSNGTLVNGSRVIEQKLSPGDEIQIGGTKFRFEV